MKFATLIKIRAQLDELSQEGLLTVVKHLIDNDHCSIIISGIFTQLYANGGKNSEQFLNDLLNCCQNASKKRSSANNKQPNETASAFDNIPDTLLSHISSYLPVNDILLCWNHIDRKCLNIGMICYPIKEFLYNLDELIETAPPQFAFMPMLSKVKLLWCNCHRIIGIDISSLKSLERIVLGKLCFFNLYV